jgi:quinol monooxygenase YgiN
MQPIVYIDTSAIREGKLEEVKPAMQHLAAFVQAHVPRLISYAFFLDEAEKEMTVVATHPDSACLEFHMQAGANEFRKFAPLIELKRIEVYGRVSEAVLRRLQEKARMLGNAPVTVHAFHAGFDRRAAS